ncbi:hypothetical protein GCM10010260_53720 [Streptomyces filipinensis]|uniref:Uncharacterized protein n=1 Tax=Streptomyces filipinensis TaxID=66887 RepID=A0A918IET7_9ACTN|nr:alpha/beta hydrolase [Streptomyces filipinensis]GGV08967.1 hypothetical protein GCM10010260_53720 [Streptomyces filipinensis]
MPVVRARPRWPRDVIIPGIDDSDRQHWQTSWERQWGTSAVRIAPASWSTPDLDDWVDAVQEAYDEASRQDSRMVLVAHSLVCRAASTWTATSTSPATWARDGTAVNSWTR